jgi:hypothetical protein
MDIPNLSLNSTDLIDHELWKVKIQAVNQHTTVREPRNKLIRLGTGKAFVSSFDHAQTLQNVHVLSVAGECLG